MKIYIKSILLIVVITAFGNAQNEISDVLKTYNTHSVPYMNPDALHQLQDNVIILDAREPEEYNVSHIKNAIYVGYNDFNINSVSDVVEDKSSSIVVYCSVGIRSETIGEKLKEAGYMNVYNLYGGIFEWVNNDLPVYDSKNNLTTNVHAYSKYWSKWLKKGEKRYD